MVTDHERNNAKYLTMYKTSVRGVVSLKFEYSYNIILRSRQTQDSKLLSQCVNIR